MVELSPTLSSAPSYVDAVDIARPSTPCSLENFGTGGLDSSASRKSRWKRPRATQINTSASEVDKQRPKVLAKTRLAANRYRLWQKEYVKNLEQGCKKEVEQTHTKSSIVNLFNKRSYASKEQLIRQHGLCNCFHVRGKSDIRDRLSN
jgi:hypothetical protein